MTEGILTMTVAHAAILEAAEKLFSRHGYAKAIMTEIASEAGLKKALPYYYFPINGGSITGSDFAKTRWFPEMCRKDSDNGCFRCESDWKMHLSPFSVFIRMRQ